MTTVKLAGKEYVLKPLPIRRAREVRQRLTGPVMQAIQAIRSSSTISLTDAEGIGSVMDALRLVLLDSIDLCLEILFEYSSELAMDRERIETEAIDEEALTAFLEVIKLLFPFGILVKSLSGLAGLATSMSSASASGTAGRTI
jgi:hypothetical protein